jgi:hypothetical protein
MVEADSHLKLLPASILEINKVFKHIDILSMGISSSLTQLYPLSIWLSLWLLGCGVTCGVEIMSLLLCHG